ncbi:myb family transcription factor EFM isoform X2 [Jatropha curcas]|uniref:myb family transcription factor EFM isoform X2 n=1 Tax=Jatropha curcas TaxID=180498 RepID=UPI0005FB02CA|nr:myb family transcription factor EFM isoform X2 [Jatropha curcas]
MASPSELSLDCKPHSYSMLLKSFGEQNYDQTQKLEEFLSRLEEERLKIDAFKRELPLCMQLLTNAVETSRQQLQAYRANQGPRPLLEEFIPLKNSTSEALDKSSNLSDKANWMTTAQLWSQESNIETKPQTTLTTNSPKETSIGFNVSPKLGLDTKQRNGGAFLPFSKERNLCPSPTLALASTDKEMEDKKCLESENGFSCSKIENSSKIGNNNSGIVIEQGKGTCNSPSDGQATNAGNGNCTNNNNNNGSSSTGQTHRKARRCWSPDLHRRFVNALQMLGGSQATPKQIRELMKVDGLTNDEVKSHLQKYRLHTRRPSPSPQAPGAQAPHVVFLGGIWVPPEYATAAAAAHTGAPTLYGAHPASHAPPPHFCAAPPVPQDFYTAAAAAPSPPPPPHHQPHHHTLHRQLHMYKAAQQTHSSPESDVRGNGERSESIEDGKSESSSWKAESGDNAGERKGLAALREDGEESNGSEITLKF